MIHWKELISKAFWQEKPPGMQRKREIPITIAVAAFAALSVRWQHDTIGVLAGFTYLLWCGWLAGKRLCPREPRHWQIFFGAIAHVAVLTVGGALIYWGYQLNGVAVGAALAVLPFTWTVIAVPRPPKSADPWRANRLRGTPRALGISALLTLAFIALVFFLFRTLIQSATTVAIRTPWQVIPAHFLFAYFMATLAILALALRTDGPGRRLPLTLLYISVSASILLLVYPIGFGFDTTIHQSTEKTIAAVGQILPKPPYYVGQYALVVISAKLFAATTVTVDRFLSPLAILAVAALAYFPWRRQSFAAMLPLAIFALPYASLIPTTPQAISNLWLLATAITTTLSWLPSGASARFRWIPFSLLLAVAALVTNPIAGIPALGIVFLTMTQSLIRGAQFWTTIFRRSLLVATTIGLIAALPILFTWNAIRNGFSLRDIWQPGLLPERFADAITPFIPGVPHRFSPLLDFAYSVGQSRVFLLAMVVVIGLAALRRYAKISPALPLLSTAIAMTASYGILQLAYTFPQVISYEQSVFPLRALDAAQFALFPLVLAGCVVIIAHSRRDAALRITLLALGAASLTAALYLVYPRVDAYHVDKGYNMSAADIAAVRQVANDAKGSYLVLANQMTSVAAVREFGFTPSYPAADRTGAKYYAYPIPTGDPLYQYYLKMVYVQPTRETAQDATRLVATDINTVYFILDRYWDNFDVIAASAKTNADRWWDISNGQALVFRYDIKR